MTGGANINQETRSGRTPLHEALRCNHLTVVEKLIIDIKIVLNYVPGRAEKQRTPLMMAVMHGSNEALEVLLTKVVCFSLHYLILFLYMIIDTLTPRALLNFYFFRFFTNIIILYIFIYTLCLFLGTERQKANRRGFTF